MKLVLRARILAWLPLLIISVPLAGFGMIAIATGAFVAGVALILLALVITGFNATAVLEIEDDHVQFRRFGVPFWRMSVTGASVEEGSAGDFGHLRGYVLKNASGKSRRFAAGLFDVESVQHFLVKFRQAGGKTL